ERSDGVMASDEPPCSSSREGLFVVETGARVEPSKRGERGADLEAPRRPAARAPDLAARREAAPSRSKSEGVEVDSQARGFPDGCARAVTRPHDPRRTAEGLNSRTIRAVLRR